ncbi:MAG: hypothetical protein ACI9YT_002368 [Halobacteriales archaeon]
MSGQHPRPTDVHVHVHLAVTGSFPLRVADLLFAGDELLVPEYEHLTPLFGLAGNGMSRASEAARERYREDGVAGLVDMAERVHRVPYDEIEAVRIYDSRIGRPKIAVRPDEGAPYAYRVHAPVDVQALTDALRSLGERRGFAVERRSKIGFHPGNALRRFLAGR